MTSIFLQVYREVPRGAIGKASTATLSYSEQEATIPIAAAQRRQREERRHLKQMTNLTPDTIVRSIKSMSPRKRAEVLRGLLGTN